MGKKQLNKSIGLSKKQKPLCIICMSKSPNTTLNCRHQFCFNCMKKWLNKSKTCPLCRQTIIAFKSNYKSKIKNMIPKLNVSPNKTPIVRTFYEYPARDRVDQQRSNYTTTLFGSQFVNFRFQNRIQISLQTI